MSLSLSTYDKATTTEEKRQSTNIENIHLKFKVPKGYILYQKKKRDLRIKSGYLWEVGVERVKGRIIYRALSILYSI